jgi:FkbM family methyltransferase
MSGDLASFEKFCARWRDPWGHRAEPKAQLDQDLWVLFELQEKRDGYFVEFGACDGVVLSNSLLLERDYGWSGVVAEPNPRWHAALKSNRKCAIDLRGVMAKAGSEPFDATAVAELGGFKRTLAVDANTLARNMSVEIEAPTVALNDLLREHRAPRTIDFLSADTEGSEVEILSAFDWDTYDVRLIAVEHNFTPAREQLRALLESKGYVIKFESRSAQDLWAVRRS